MAADLSAADQDFLAKCEEQLKDRFTEKDDDFMSVFKCEPSKPPVIDWWYTNSSYRRNNHRFSRRHHPYERHGNNRNRDRGSNDYNREDRGSNDYSRDDRGSSDYNREDKGQGYRPQRNRYQY